MAFTSHFSDGNPLAIRNRFGSVISYFSYFRALHVLPVSSAMKGLFQIVPCYFPFKFIKFNLKVFAAKFVIFHILVVFGHFLSYANSKLLLALTVRYSLKFWAILVPTCPYSDKKQQSYSVLKFCGVGGSRVFSYFQPGCANLENSFPTGFLFSSGVVWVVTCLHSEQLFAAWAYLSYGSSYLENSSSIRKRFPFRAKRVPTWLYCDSRWRSYDRFKFVEFLHGFERTTRLAPPRQPLQVWWETSWQM